MFGLFHPELHPVFEALGYAGGFAFYRHARKRSGDFLDEEHRWIVIAAAAIGALVGSRVLGMLEQAPRIGLNWQSFIFGGGKTIVGGLLGGWLAVEFAKRLTGVTSRTGDLFAVPLCIGIAIGRIGCFFAGLADDTYGKPTSLPWAVDFGDGIARHPTQLYEVLFLAALGVLLWRHNQRPHQRGRAFRVFMFSYLSWRIAVDFLKPQPLVAGMNLIQWACVVGLLAVGFGELTNRSETSNG